MKIFYGLPNPKYQLPCILTIGNFDGFHPGHKELIINMQKASKYYNLPICVMLFEPHPIEFLQPNNMHLRITLLRDKIESLLLNKVDQVIIKKFNYKFSQLSPEKFIKEIIVSNLKAKLVIIGKDFYYGLNRTGNYNLLKKSGDKYGFKVKEIKTIKNKFGDKISSSNIRKKLVNGEINEVKNILRRPYTISGHIVHGLKNGRNIGYPTMNVMIFNKKIALSGVLSVLVHGLIDKPILGVANIGLRPTISNNKNFFLEVHVFNWKNEVYGKLIKIEFLKKIRDQKKFINLKMLKNNIINDIKITKYLFSNYIFKKN